MPNIRVKKKKCKEKECENLAHSRGYCMKHYMMRRKNGKLKKLFVECGLCKNEVHKKGFCKKHYEEWEKYYDSYDLIKQEGLEKLRDLKRFGTCIEQGCSNPCSTSKSYLCKLHYIRRYEAYLYAHNLKDSEGRVKNGRVKMYKKIPLLTTEELQQIKNNKKKKCKN